MKYKKDTLINLNIKNIYQICAFLAMDDVNPLIIDDYLNPKYKIKIYRHCNNIIFKQITQSSAAADREGDRAQYELQKNMSSSFVQHLKTCRDKIKRLNKINYIISEIAKILMKLKAFKTCKDLKNCIEQISYENFIRYLKYENKLLKYIKKNEYCLKIIFQFIKHPIGKSEIIYLSF